MNDYSTNNNKIIAKNTLMLYIRMFFLMIVNLYTARVVLQVLGVEDYGVYNAIAGFIAMFSMISSSLSTAISRFLTYVLGQGDLENLKSVFRTSIIIQMILSFIVLLLVESIGVWFLNTHMTIPEGRNLAANVVLQLSLLTFIINLLSVPYNASLIAHEKMDAFAYIGIFEGLAMLLIAFLLKVSPVDSLIFYSSLMCIVAGLVRIIYSLYCNRHFEECKFKWQFDKVLFKEMFGFATWNFIGSTAGLLRSQGINILFNVYNGPVVNAARALASQVNLAVNKFSSGFYTAVQPQITKSFANNNIDESFNLVIKSSRFAFYLLSLLCLPLIFEIEFILNLWLGQVPKHTEAFVQIILLYSLMESFSQPLIHLMLATGNIKKYQITVGFVNLINFPIAWLIIYFGYAPEIAQFSVIIFSLIATIVRIYMLNNQVGFPAGKFCYESIFRGVFLFLIACIIPCFITLKYNIGLTRFLVNVFLTEIVSIFIFILWGMSASERKFIFSKIKSIANF